MMKLPLAGVSFYLYQLDPLFVLRPGDEFSAEHFYITFGWHRNFICRLSLALTLVQSTQMIKLYRNISAPVLLPNTSGSVVKKLARNNRKRFPQNVGIKIAIFDPVYTINLSLYLYHFILVCICSCF